MISERHIKLANRYPFDGRPPTNPFYLAAL